MTTNGGVFMPLILRRFVYGFAWSGLLLLALAARADDKATIVKNSEQALADLRGYASGSAALLDKAAGVLVFPRMVKVGFGGAEEFGEGVLLVQGKPEAFYSSAGADYGLPLGVRAKSEVVVFMTPAALKALRAGPAWKVGKDGDVTLVRLAAGGGVEAASAGEPILGFIFSEKGLAGGLTLKGAEFTRIAR